ncbi:hypothetical protein CCACVL1_09614 [Corchorus capsularis]|uniref:Uncharacterized protein n=1 Tax=Corchorus capsularis TaxID=210143 RepID=A0A1R3IUW0_COCAP|nr:hypothetical protein CCACVL1_09614 [Corchorus capsularis]
MTAISLLAGIRAPASELALSVSTSQSISRSQFPNSFLPSCKSKNLFGGATFRRPGLIAGATRVLVGKGENVREEDESLAN